MGSGTFLNPKIRTEIEESKKITSIVSRFFDLINNETLSMNRIEIVQLLESLNSVFGDRIAHLFELERKTRDLFKKINIAENYLELRDIHAELNELSKEFFIDLPSVTDLHGICTDYRDRISKKIVSLTVRELMTQGLYLPDESFAYICLGSDGREEQTLLTDQDNLIVYQDSESRYKEYFYENLSALLVERLATCGFKKCTGEIMPSNPKWRGAFTQWMNRIDYMCEFADPDFKKNLVNLIVMTDLRFVYGDEDLGARFIDHVYKKLFENHIVLNEIAKSAATLGTAKGFMNALRVEKKGEHKGLLNIKLYGWAPLILAIRAFAIKNKIVTTGTLRRIDELVKKGAFSAQDGEKYRKAYFLLTRMKIMAQIMYLNGKYDSDIYMNPDDLSPAEHKELIEVLTDIEALQKLLMEVMGLRV